MAAVGIHIVYIGRKPVTPAGGVLNKETATIKEMQTASSENRILPNTTDVPNSAGYPSIETFLKLEAAAGYKAAVINQTMIILYNG